MTKKSEAKATGKDETAGGETEILQKLSERVETAIRTIRDLRKERDDLAAKLKDAEGRLDASEEESEQVKELLQEKKMWVSDRTEVRNRIEKILGRLEQLDEPEE